MIKQEWGTKRICTECGIKYYDMQKKPPHCPKCGTEFNADSIIKSRKSKIPHFAEDADDINTAFARDDELLSTIDDGFSISDEDFDDEPDQFIPSDENEDE